MSKKESLVTNTLQTMLCPFPFPLLNPPSFLSSALLNQPHTHRRGVKMYDMETSKADQVEEDFIDIEVNPSHCREFEFQLCSSSLEKGSKSTSPADELFYKGKLLPLQKLLHNSISPAFHVTQNLAYEEGGREEECRAPIVASSSFSTPLESCNISPEESCRGSCEVNPDEYFFQWSTEVSGFIGCGGGGGETHLLKKKWCKKMRLIKQSSLTQKLKSSRAYLRSLFMKSACSDEANCAKTVGGVECGEEEEGWNVSKAKEYVSKHLNIVKRNPFGQVENERNHQASSFTMKSILEREMDDQISFTCHRKSFSEAIKRHCTSKCYSSSSTSSSNCSSSSSSFSLKSSNGFYEISLLKRSISSNSEVENSIEGAIAHCKKSQLKHDNPQPKIAASEVESCLASSASRVAACGGDSGRPEISRI